MTSIAQRSKNVYDLFYILIFFIALAFEILSELTSFSKRVSSEEKNWTKKNERKCNFHRNNKLIVHIHTHVHRGINFLWVPIRKRATANWSFQVRKSSVDRAKNRSDQIWKWCKLHRFNLERSTCARLIIIYLCICFPCVCAHILIYMYVYDAGRAGYDIVIRKPPRCLVTLLLPPLIIRTIICSLPYVRDPGELNRSWIMEFRSDLSARFVGSFDSRVKLIKTLSS